MQLRRLALLALGTGLFLISAGCAGDPQPGSMPSAPELADTNADSELLFVPLAPVVRPEPQATYSASRWISAAMGGEIRLAGMRVRFPAGSLPSSTIIRLVVRTDDEVALEILPADIPLRSPAIITLDDLSLTNGRTYHNVAFYTQATPAVAQPTSNDWRRPQAWVSTTGAFVLGGTRWDISGIQPIRYLHRSGRVTQWVPAATGGTIVVDRVKLTIHAWALNCDTHITIRQKSEDGALIAELQPHGLQFRSAVTLEIDLDGLQWQPYEDWSIYWLNPVTNNWEDQDGTFDHRRVTAEISHFSTYAPARGRAGW